MNKSFILGLCTGLVLSSIGIITYLPNIAEAIYSIPPTNAWDLIISDDNATFVDQGETNVTAISYRDTLYLISDGSINITMVPYP